MLNIHGSLSLSTQEGGFSPFTIFMTFSWTFPSTSMSPFHWGARAGHRIPGMATPVLKSKARQGLCVFWLTGQKLFKTWIVLTAAWLLSHNMTCNKTKQTFSVGKKKKKKSHQQAYYLDHDTTGAISSTCTFHIELFNSTVICDNLL